MDQNSTGTMVPELGSTTQNGPALESTTPRARAAHLPSGLLHKYGVILVWGIVILIFGIAEPGKFATSNNFASIFSGQASLLVLSLALLPTIIVGEYDLSVASTATISATVLGELNGVHHVTLWLSVLAALGCAALVGIANGCLTVYGRVEGIVVTLGMGTLLLGIAVGLSNSLPISGLSTTLDNVMTDQFLGLSDAFWYAVGFIAIAWFVSRQMVVGRHMLFTGANRNAARLIGLRVNRLRIGGFVTGAVLAGIAGVIIIGQSGGIEADSLQTLLLPAFAAVFLGSALFQPGRPNVLGTAVAVLFLATGITGLELLGVSNWISDVFYGIALIVGVTLSQLAALRAARRAR